MLHSDITSHMRYSYEVPGMILLQASYPYTQSLLRGATFEVLPLSCCTISPTMLPLLEILLELLLWNIFQCRRYIFYVFNILKSSIVPLTN